MTRNVFHFAKVSGSLFLLVCLGFDTSLPLNAETMNIEVSGSRIVSANRESQWHVSATGAPGATLAFSATGPGVLPPAVGPDYFQTLFSGMMQDEEPDEGPVPLEGRTYRGSFRLWNDESVTAIQFLMGNLSSQPVRGARMVVGISANGNSSMLPTREGVPVDEITGNPRTGWVRVYLSGAQDLPVPSDTDGTGLAWTDPVQFAPAFDPTQGEVVWRIWIPSSNVATYARTFSGGAGNVQDTFSVLRSFAILQRDLFGENDWMRFGYADGDWVSNPAVGADWVTTPNPGAVFSAYGTAYVSSIPILGYRWNATRPVRLIEFVGDSITQGYGDWDQIVNMDGVPGKLLRAFGVGSDARYSIVNFGQSGFTPEQYLARWKGLARADPAGATAMAYSIFSPNGFAGESNQSWERVDEMKANCLAAEAACAELGRKFIPVFITGTNMFFLNPCLDQRPPVSWCRDETDKTKALLDWAKDRYGSRLLDLHQAITDPSTIGPSMLGGLSDQPIYTIDHTHPSTSGYSALGVEAVSKFEAVVNQALVSP